MIHIIFYLLIFFHVLLSATIDSNLGLSDIKPAIIWDSSKSKNRTLYGRFLHITDIHPDIFYKEGSFINKLCHTNDKDTTNNKNDIAPFFGKPMSGCDTPITLMNYTLNWIRDKFDNKIDFIVWSGDNIRHDSDRNYPRTEEQIFNMNEILSNLFSNLFPDKDNPDDPWEQSIDIIPSLGNNDVFPHNMFSLGPTLQTRKFYRIWRHFIPQSQQRSFTNGISFFREIIPNKLAIISINTLYLFKNNPLVDNCSDFDQPGYKLLLWFGSILNEMRKRNIKIWLTGHIPPIEKNFEKNCYLKFNNWVNEFNDIIIGGIYGHMNVDHFIPIDTKDIKNQLNSKSILDFNIDDYISELAKNSRDYQIFGAKPINKESYLNDVRNDYYSMISTENKRSWNELVNDYNIVNIAGSIIPTFNPSFRIWEYNITDLNDTPISSKEKEEYQRSLDEFFNELDLMMNSSFDQFNEFDDIDRTMPKPRPIDILPGPGYINQLFSPTRFIQYYIDLNKINSNYYSLLKNGKSSKDAADLSFNVDIEYTSDKYPYNMENLLVGDYLKLANRLSNDDNLWSSFKKNAFILADYHEDND